MAQKEKNHDEKYSELIQNEKTRADLEAFNRTQAEESTAFAQKQDEDWRLYVDHTYDMHFLKEKEQRQKDVNKKLEEARKAQKQKELEATAKANKDQLNFLQQFMALHQQPPPGSTAEMPSIATQNLPTPKPSNN